MKNIYSKNIRLVVFILAVLVLTIPLFSQQAVIELGLAGNCVILAKQGVTNTGPSIIIGHVASNYHTGARSIRGFGLPHDEDEDYDYGTVEYATSGLVNGKVFANDMAAPTPALLAQAENDMVNAYADGVSRTTGAVYENDATEEQILDQTVLAGPGLYRWNSSIIIYSNIEITGTATDVWIFQLSGFNATLRTAQSVQVTVSGGAQAKNIFWVVAGGATIEEYSHITGTILSQSTIAFHTAASLEGKALSNTNVTLLNNYNIIYDGDVPETLPVTLSSFTAGATATGMVMLQWTAETETNLLGYNIYRGDDSVLNNARKVNFIIVAAHNSSIARNYSYIDENIEQGNTYHYWLQSNDLGLTEEFHGPISITIDIEDESGNRIKPDIVTELKEAYPNPFNPGTNILFSLAETADVKITIFNTKGQLVRLLVDNQSFDKGNNHTVYWDGKDEDGNGVSSGIYFYTMETAGDYKAIKRMLLLK